MRHLLSLLLLLAACAAPLQAEEKRIKIAVAGPMTGAAAFFGHSIKLGARLAIQQANARGRLRFELLVSDDKGRPQEALNVARQLSEDRAVRIVIGHFNSACSNAAKEVYNKAGLVSLSPGSTNPAVCRGYKWTFRNLYNDRQLGPHLARYARATLGLSRVAVLYDGDEYGRTLLAAFVDGASKVGFKVVARVPYQRERTQDFRPLLRSLLPHKPDGLFIAGLYNEGALIARAARQLLPKATLIGGDGLIAPGLIRTAGEAADGLLAAAPWQYDAAAPRARTKAFVAAYKAANEREPDAWAALSYDAVGMAVAAIRAVGTDRGKIREWLAGRTTRATAYHGVVGPTWFDAQGDCLRPPMMLVVKGGKFVQAEKQPGEIEGK